MQAPSSRLLFDGRDYELLALVEEVRSRESSRKLFGDLLNPYLNPHGIKEMAAAQEFRIAYAMANLLHSLEIGQAADRLSALRTLHDEVLNITHSSFRLNTARVLLQIMKRIVRREGGDFERLALAHDFRMAVSGRPRLIREELRRYHLFEMPEEWNQIAFDDHVHDANTKGRKTPTHLIMDAWIKGIRRLTVIYYNYVRPEAAEELLEAGEIMGISIRIGISVGARFRGRQVRFIWVPRGFCDARDFLAFLAEPAVQAFMEEERLVSEYQKKHVLALLAEFNARHRPAVNEAFGVALPPLSAEEFLAFVGSGQASILHLAEFIHTHLLPLLRAKVEELRRLYEEADPDERLRIEGLVARMRELDSEAIVESYLRPFHNPGLPDPNFPPADAALPAMLGLSPYELLLRLQGLHSGYRLCLNLSDLRMEDVLEMIYDCKGMITHLEIFNLKDHVDGKTAHYGEISELQQAINEGNVISLKRLIRRIRERLEGSGAADAAERIAKFTEILRNIPLLLSYYRGTPLGAYLGSDSTGRSYHRFGMGLVLRETLPQRARRRISRDGVFVLPVRMQALRTVTHIPSEGAAEARGLRRFLHLFPFARRLEERRRLDWVVQEKATRLASPGNVVPLGSPHQEGGNDLYLHKRSQEGAAFSWRYLSSSLKNGLKVATGFIPAFLTFLLTKDWGILAYGGAFIWFGITGLRNVIQSVLGGGGFRRSPLLRWNDYVSWDRLTDSLLFTGFSVPLLDYLVKTVLLDRLLGITTATSPELLYAVMALANGLYLSSHNAFRGLPKAAVVGNLFRTLLSIPLAVTFNDLVGIVLAEAGTATMEEVDAILETWAAVISKTASDCVAGLIEGLADRHENIRLRSLDYSAKLGQLFDAYARLEVLFPETDVLAMLESPKQFIRTLSAEARDLERAIIINALDLLYFWMYQPRARSVLLERLKAMSEEERRIFLRLQGVLQRQREISQLFLDGIIGRNFSRGLAFYLERYEEYLRSLHQTASSLAGRQAA